MAREKVKTPTTPINQEYNTDEINEILGSEFEDLTPFQKAILRENWINPSVKLIAIQHKYRVSRGAVHDAMRARNYVAAELKLNADFFRRGRMAVEAALENAFLWLTSTDPDLKQEKREMTKLFVAKALESDKLLPEPDIDGPKFIRGVIDSE